MSLILKQFRRTATYPKLIVWNILLKIKGHVELKKETAIRIFDSNSGSSIYIFNNLKIKITYCHSQKLSCTKWS